MTEENEEQLTKICFGSFWVEMPLKSDDTSPLHMGMASSVVVKSNEVDGTRPLIKFIHPALKETKTNKSAVVNAKEIVVPQLDLILQSGDMPKSVPPCYSEIWASKQHTILAKSSAKKQIRSAEKAGWRSDSNSSAIYQMESCRSRAIILPALQEQWKLEALNKFKLPPLVCKGKENLVHKHHRKQLWKRSDTMAILSCASPSIERHSNQNILKSDASKFIASMAHRPSEQCSEAMNRLSLELNEVYSSSHDCRTDHVNSTVTLSKPISSPTRAVQESIEGLYIPVGHKHQRWSDRRINLRRVIVGKVRVRFSQNMENNLPDHRFCINKGGLRIHTMVTSNASTVVAFIRFIWKKYFNHAKHRAVGLDCEYTRYIHRKERRKLPLEEQAALSNQEPQRAAVLQLCVGKHCLVYQLYQAHARGSIPPLLRWFLANDTIQFAGAAIGNDIKKLEFYNLSVTNTVDLQQLGIKVRGHKEGQLVSLEKLAKKVAKIKLNKDKSVSVSLWESSNLNHEQIKYACLDAYASFEIFRRHSNVTRYLRSH